MKKIELIKFIFGTLFCSIAFLGATLFFLGYFNLAIGADNHETFINSFSQVWCSNSTYGQTGVNSYTTIFLAVCGVCGSYLLTNVKSKD